MRKFCNIVYIFVVCMFITSCNNKEGVSDMFLNEFNVDNGTSLEELLTKEYSIDELKAFFETYDFNETLYFNSSKPSLSFDEVNKYFPVEVVRPGGYTVYSVKQGGYYYVFWSDLCMSENGYVDNKSFVFLVSYLDVPKDKSVFNVLKTGISTAENVKELDSYVELCFLRSSGVFSYSFLNDENILEIEYDKKNNISNYNDLCIKQMKVIPRNSAASRYSLIQTKDLPQ